MNHKSQRGKEIDEAKISPLATNSSIEYLCLVIYIYSYLYVCIYHSTFLHPFILEKQKNKLSPTCPSNTYGEFPHRSWTSPIMASPLPSWIRYLGDGMFFVGGLGSITFPEKTNMAMSKISYMGVSKNRGTPKWMVYNGNPS